MPPGGFDEHKDLSIKASDKSEMQGGDRLEFPKPGDQASNLEAIGRFSDVGLPRAADSIQERNSQVQNVFESQLSTGAGMQKQLTSSDGSKIPGFESFDKNSGQRTFFAANQDGSSTYTPYRFNSDRSALIPVNDGDKPIALRQNSDSASANKAEAGGIATTAKDGSVTLKGQVHLEEQQRNGGEKDTAERRSAARDAKKEGTAADKTGDGKAQGQNAKPGEGAPHQIDGKLLAQLQGLGRSPDLRNSFADLINKFQDNKLSQDGKEGGLRSMLHGMQSSEINGLKAWLTDSRHNPFDFKSLDTNSQSNISKILDTLTGRGQEEKSITLMPDASIGLRNSMSSSSSSSELPVRTLDGGKGQTDFTINVTDLNASLQATIARLQARDATSQERTPAARQDSNQGDAKPGVSSGRAVKDTLANIEDITKKERSAKNKLNESPQSTIFDTKFKSPDSSEGSKQDKAADSLAPKPFIGETTSEQLEDAKQKKLAEQSEREMQERTQREAAERQQQEKEKQQREQNQDDESSYTVKKHDTLNSISESIFKSKEIAQVIYDRNFDSIMQQQHKGQNYAKLRPGQVIVIPNSAYIDKFKRSSKSHSNINFGRPDYASAEEEVMAMFGKNWASSTIIAPGSAANKEQNEPIKRRRFSGNSGELSDSVLRVKARQTLGVTPETGNSVNLVNKSDNLHVVRVGESLRSIALKRYNNPSYWQLLAIKNNLSTEVDKSGSPLIQLKRGQTLSLPAEFELESFARNATSARVVALCKTAHGLDLPRKRECGNCKRNTLAVAVKCVACGQDLEAAANKDQQQAAAMTPARDFFDQTSAGQLQEFTLTNQSRQTNFSPENHSTAEQDSASLAHPPHDLHPLPKAALTHVDFEYDQPVDPLWIANTEPELLDPTVQIAEFDTMAGDERGLVVTLQLFHEGEWRILFDYNIRESEVIIRKYQRNGGYRLMKKGLPAKQSKQMALNHFRNSWRAICQEFWSS